MTNSKHIPSLKSSMTPFPYTVDVKQRAEVALSMMEEHDIRHLPVTKNGELHGVISERDLSLIMSLTEDFGELFETTVGDICSSAPYVVELHTPLAEVLLEMAKRHIGSALVVRNAKLAGIFTTTDACRCFGELIQNNDGNLDPEVA